MLSDWALALVARAFSTLLQQAVAFTSASSQLRRRAQDQRSATATVAMIQPAPLIGPADPRSSRRWGSRFGRRPILVEESRPARHYSKRTSMYSWGMYSTCRTRHVNGQCPATRIMALKPKSQPPLVGCEAHIWLLGCAAWSTPSTMPPQQHLVDTAGASLIGLVFSAVCVPPLGEHSASSSHADAAGYMGSRVSKHSHIMSIMITQIASFLGAW
jgi:hypothetical protein